MIYLSDGWELAVRSLCVFIELAFLTTAILALIGTRGESFAIKFKGNLAPFNAIYTYVTISCYLGLLALAMLAADLGVTAISTRFRWMHVFHLKGLVFIACSFLSFGLGNFVGLMCFILSFIYGVVLLFLSAVDEPPPPAGRAKAKAKAKTASEPKASSSGASTPAARTPSSAAAPAEDAFDVDMDSDERELERAAGVRA